MSDLSPEEITEQERAEKAFTDSGRYSFRGEVLKPYSLDREDAAEVLGLRIHSGVKLKRIAVNDERGKPTGGAYVSYPGMFRDMLSVLFLCTLETSEIIRLTSSSHEPNYTEFWTRAYKWGEERGARPKNEVGGEMYVLFSQIIHDSRATQVEAKSDGPRKQIKAAPGN